MSGQAVFGRHVICGDVLDVLPALDTEIARASQPAPPPTGDPNQLELAIA